ARRPDKDVLSRPGAPITASFDSVTGVLPSPQSRSAAVLCRRKSCCCREGISAKYWPMAGRLTLLVIADPSAPFLTPLSQLPDDVRVLICDQPDELRAKISDADVILYAHTDAALLLDVLPLASRVNWIHSLWTGVEGILGPPLKDHPAPLTNGRGVFRWPLADWVTAALLFFAFDLRRIVDQQGRSEWQPFIGTTLNGRSLGIVRYGALG